MTVFDLRRSTKSVATPSCSYQPRTDFVDQQPAAVQPPSLLTHQLIVGDW